MSSAARDPLDTAERRKARGAFFTPALIASFIAQWAIRDASDRVLEPSSGDAEFLVHAVRTLHGLGHERPQVWGAELHEWSASSGARRVDEGDDPGQRVREIGRGGRQRGVRETSAHILDQRRHRRAVRGTPGEHRARGADPALEHPGAGTGPRADGTPPDGRARRGRTAGDAVATAPTVAGADD